MLLKIVRHANNMCNKIAQAFISQDIILITHKVKFPYFAKYLNKIVLINFIFFKWRGVNTPPLSHYFIKIIFLIVE